MLILFLQEYIDLVIKKTLNDIINQVVNHEKEPDNLKSFLNKTWSCVDKVQNDECELNSIDDTVSDNFPYKYYCRFKILY